VFLGKQERNATLLGVMSFYLGDQMCNRGVPIWATSLLDQQHRVWLGLALKNLGHKY